MRIVAALLGVLLMAKSVTAQTATPAPGIALELATRRASVIRDLRYQLTLSIPETLAAPIVGSMEIRFTLVDASGPLVLDFDTSPDHAKTIEANGRPSAFTYVNGHLVVPSGALGVGANVLRLTFTAGDGSLNRSADFLYTLFVPPGHVSPFPASTSRI